MKVMDYVINLMSQSGEEDETGHHESLATMLLTVLLSLLVVMMIV